MIPEMKQVLQQNYDDIEVHRQQTENTLKSIRSEVEEITQHKSSLQSEIRRVSQQAMNLIRRKEKKLLDELDTLIEKQTGELRGQIKSEEIDLQTYQQYTEFIKQVLQSNSLMDLYDTYTLCQSVDLTAVMQRKDKQGERTKKVEFEDQVDMDEFERILKFGRLKVIKNQSQLEDTPKPLSAVSAKSKEDFTVAVLHDIEVLNVDGTDTLVVVDFNNKSIKSSYTKDKKQLCTSLKLNQQPFSLTKISQDRVAVSYYSHNSIELIKLTPDPVRITTIETKKKYEYLTAFSDTTLAAGCGDPPSIDVLDLSGRVLRSVITPSNGQQLIQSPCYMCTTRQGHIVMSDGGSGSVYCVTQQGEVLYTYQLTGRYWTGGVTTTDTGSVIVANNYGNKIVQLTERGEYVRDLLTGRDGIVEPLGIRVHGNKLYVTEYINDHIKLFQL